MTATDAPLVHITNGDSVAELLRRSGLPGDIVPWRDSMHMGPAPAGLDAAALRGVRADFLHRCGWGERGKLLRSLESAEASLGRLADAELVLWFEHDLFDQIQLIHILDSLAQLPRGQKPPQLVCIGSFPGVEPFHGLGQLAPGDLASLFERRAPIGNPETDLATRAFRAYRSPDPRGIEAIRRGEPSALPFLAGALLRHLEEFPGVGDGLSRSQRQTLAALRAGGRSGAALFRAQQEAEDHPFLGDWPFWLLLEDLADASFAAVRIDGDRAVPAIAKSSVELTDFGRAVLEGDEDWSTRNGVDRWVGGVFLSGHAPAWRFDTARRALVESGATS